jgi:transposase
LRQAYQLVRGLDVIGAATRMVAIATDMDTLGAPEKRTAWAGDCPGNNESAGKCNTGRKRKGNPYVRCILCASANAASRIRGSLAHEILLLVFVLSSRGKYYRTATVEDSAISVGRNAPRWT